jgi:hypothetical protein
MIRPNSGLKINVAEQRSRPIIRSTHRKLQSTPGLSESSSSIDYDDFFNNLLAVC